MPSTVWKGFLSFGLVSFPVRLHSAGRAKRVAFHLLHKKDHSRVKEVYFCAEEEERIERSEMVKGYEVSEGEYVAVEEEELKKIAPTTATTMEVLQFVAAGEVDPLYYETAYYVEADKPAAKAYALFLAALTETRQEAIAKLAMHNREHVVLLRAAGEGLVLHTLFYENEIQAANRGERAAAKYTAKELEMAKSLVGHLAAKFDPKAFRDEYRENVEKLIAQKQAGERVTGVKQPKMAPVVDLMEALKRSLEGVKGAGRSKGRKRRAA